MSNETEQFPSDKAFREAVAAQSKVEELASYGELTHESLFDEAGHVSENMGDVAVAIVDGNSAWSADGDTKDAIMDVLGSERREGTPENVADDHDAALAENSDRVEESGLRVAAGTVDKARWEVAEVAAGSPFPEGNPTSGSVEDHKLASRLSDGVREVAQEQANRTAEVASKRAISPPISPDTYLPKKAGDATNKVLQDVVRREPHGFFGAIKGLFHKQPSRTDRVVEGINLAAQEAGVRAQQAGDAVRAEQEKAAAAEREKSPF